MTTKKKPAATRDRSGALYALVGADVLEDLEAVVARLNEKNDGPQWSRQDVVRRILGRGLKSYLEKGELP